MTIKEIRTRYISNSPFANLVDEPVDFTPHWHCTIATDEGAFSGNGDTEQAAEDDAMNNLRRHLALAADRALEAYMARIGSGTLDIA